MGNELAVQQYREALGKHEKHRLKKPARTKRSKAALLPGKRLDPLLGAFMTSLIVGQMVAGAAAEIHFRRGRPLAFNQDQDAGHSKDGKNDGKNAVRGYQKGAADLPLREIYGKWADRKDVARMATHAISPPGIDSRQRRPVVENSVRVRKSRHVGEHDNPPQNTIRLIVNDPFQHDHLTIATQFISGRPQYAAVAKSLIEKGGQDPYQKVSVSYYANTGGSDSGTALEVEHPLIELVMRRFAHGSPATSASVPSELKNIPDVWKVYQGFAQSYLHGWIDIASSDTVDAFQKKGFSGLTKVSRYAIGATDKNPLWPHPAVPSHLGEVWEIHKKNGGRLYVAVVPNDNRLLVELPHEETARWDWLKQNMYLFYGSNSFAVFQLLRYRLVPISENINIARAAKEGMTKIFSDINTRIAPVADDDSWFDKLSDWAWDAMVPLYGSVRALQRGDYEWAVLAAMLDVTQYGPPVADLWVGARKVGQWIRKSNGFRAVADVAAALRPSNVRSALGKLSSDSFDSLTRARAAQARSLAAVAAPPSPAVQAVLGDVNSILERNRSVLRNFIENPLEKCEAAIEPVMNIFKSEGYETYVRGMYIFSGPKDYLPANHFAVGVRKNGVDVMVDLTSGQSRRLKLAEHLKMNIPDTLVAPEEQWARIYQAAGKQRYIVYRDFSSKQTATRTFSSALNQDPAELIHGAIALNYPEWIRNLHPVVIAPRHARLRVPKGKKHKYVVTAERAQPR